MVESYNPKYINKNTYEDVKNKIDGKFNIIKKNSTIIRVYYDLSYNGNIIGKAWIRKKESYFRQGLYIYIEPDYRRKGYGTIFYNMLAIEMENKDISFIILKINKHEKIARKFIEKQIDKYDDRFYILNKIIYIHTLILKD